MTARHLHTDMHGLLHCSVSAHQFLMTLIFKGLSDDR